MSDSLYDIAVIKKCATDILPNNVLFAMGDSEKVACASIWIRWLEKENAELKAEIDKRNFLIKDSVDLLSAIKNDQSGSWSYLISKYLENIKELTQGSKDEQ